MAAQGEDTTSAAFHILAQTKFQVFIPLHSLTLGQDYCLIYMLLPPIRIWIQPAIDRVHSENDVTPKRVCYCYCGMRKPLLQTKSSRSFHKPR